MGLLCYFGLVLQRIQDNGPDQTTLNICKEDVIFKYYIDI